MSQWNNGNGTVTPGIVIEDGAGNKITSFGSGGSGGAVTVADGADTTLGLKADAIATVAAGSAGSFSLISLAKQFVTTLQGWLSVNIGIGGAAISASNPVPIYDAYTAPLTASWTSATPLNTAFALATGGMDTVIFTIATGASTTAGGISFQAFDGYNWVNLKAPRTDSYQTDSTFSLAGSPSVHSWQLPVAGYPQVRAILTTAIVGPSTTYLVGIVSSAPDTSLVTVGLDPAQPLPAGANTLGNVNQALASAGFEKITDGTTMMAVKAASTAAAATDPAAVVALSPNSPLPAGSNAIGAVSVTALPPLPDNSSGSATISSAAVLTGFPLSTAGYNKFTFNVQTAFTGTLALEGSNDGGSNWYAIEFVRTDNIVTGSAVYAINAAAGYVYEAAIGYAQVRLRASVYTSGSGVVQWNLKNATLNRIVVEQGPANSTNTWPVKSYATSNTGGGVPSAASIVNTAASTSPTSVKTSAGQVYSIDLSNNSAGWVYFRLYNLASAPTVGTSTVFAGPYGVAPGASRTISFADLGLAMGAGVAYSLTAGATLNDATTIAAAASIVGTLHYA